jgi:hypothetical protein
MKVEQEKRKILAKEKRMLMLRDRVVKLSDWFVEYAREINTHETRVADIDTLISSLDPAADAARIAVLTDEKNDLAIRIAELERILELISDKLENNEQQIRDFGDINAEKKEFVETYSVLGYGDTFEYLGWPKMTDLKIDDYDPLAFNAIKIMVQVFWKEPDFMNRKQILQAFHQWQKDWIGKAKLVPGKHHLLFGQYTVRYIHRLLNSFIDMEDPDKVNSLRMELMVQCRGAKGLPWYTKDYVEKQLGQGEVPSLVRYKRKVREASYMKRLWKLQVKYLSGITQHIADLLPFTWGKEGEDGGPVEMEAPWIYDEIEADTSK